MFEIVASGIPPGEYTSRVLNDIHVIFIKLPCSRKIWRGIKFGALADRSTYRQIKIHQYLIHVYIPRAHARALDAV